MGTLVLGLGMAGAGAVAADTLRVQGQTLEGRVVDLDATGVSFEAVYGKGAFLVSYDDLEDLQTEQPFAVLYGGDGESHGRILGFEEGQLLIGADRDSAERVEAKTVLRAYADAEFESSPLERLRSRFRHWSASLDAGVAVVDSTTDTTVASTAFRAERQKGPTRLLVEGSFRYADEKKRDEPRSVTENIAIGRVRGEYDLWERLFSFASLRATYDEERHLSLRLEPRGGLGLRILKRDEMTLDADVGAAWVYEDYFGKTEIPGTGPPPLFRSRGRDDFWTVSFGGAFLRKLPFGSVFRASGEYLPAIDAWVEQYLLRGEASLEFPLVEWLALTLRAIDEYDSKPAEDTEYNSLTLTAGLSLRF